LAHWIALDHVSAIEVLDHVEEMKSWKLSKHLAFELVFQIKINTSEEANKETRSIYSLPGLDHLLKHEYKLRKLWYETGIQHAKQQ
jgi:hypothetical protein